MSNAFRARIMVAIVTAHCLFAMRALAQDNTAMLLSSLAVIMGWLSALHYFDQWKASEARIDG